MTIAAAVCYPPDDLAITNLPMVESAVIVAADSLYSDQSGQPVRDDGIKLALLAKNVVAAFAGDVSPARKALRELKGLMAAGTFQPFEERAARLFESYVPPDSKVHCLIGGVTTDSTYKPFIIKLLCKNGICDSTVSYSCELIGGNSHLHTMFKGFLNDMHRLSGGYSTPGKMALRVGEALSSTMEAGTAQYIGGKVQMVWVTKDKLVNPHLFSINPNSIDSPNITHLSWQLDELH